MAVCFLIAQGPFCGSVRVGACVCVCVPTSDASLLVWLLFSKKTGGFLPPAHFPFPPLIAASWVQADSSSCLFSLIYQARADKCKHLPEYPPHLGALGGWMCSIFYPHMADQCIILTCLSDVLRSLFLSSTFTPRPKTPFPLTRPWTGVATDGGLKLC